MVLEEGNHPLLRCPKCDMFFPWRWLNRENQAMYMCAKGVERKLKRLMEEEAQTSTTVDLQAYRRPMETVMAFKYIGRVLTASDGN